MVWSSPIFYLVQLANIVWLISYEISVQLYYKSTGIESNIEALGKLMKQPNCKIDDNDIVAQILKDRMKKRSNYK